VLESTREIKRNILLGKSLDKERIEKMRLSNTLRKSVLIINNETGDTLEFTSLTEAGKYLGISRVSVSKYLLKGIPYKGYTISNLDAGAENPLEIKGSQQAILLLNNETGDRKECTSMTEAANYLNISRAGLWYFLNKTVKLGNETLKGYTITKLDKDVVNRGTKKLEITDLETKEIKVYPSFTLAAKALDVAPSSLSGYFANNRTNPFRKRYILKLL